MELLHSLSTVFPLFRALCEDIRITRLPRHTASPVSWRSLACRARAGPHQTTHCSSGSERPPPPCSKQSYSVTCPRVIYPTVSCASLGAWQRRTPFSSPTTIILFEMTAITAQFPSEMKKRTGMTPKTLLNVLTAACACALWRSHMNDSHMRRHVSKGRSPQPVGTTSNEALHAELRLLCGRCTTCTVPSCVSN